MKRENLENHVTLIGAGLAGSLLSLYLVKKGFRVTIYESRPDMRQVDISAGRSINLALANRGILPLEEVGVMPEVRKKLIPMQGRMLHDEQGQLQFQAYGSRDEEVIYSVSRQDLNSILMDAAEATGQVEILFNQVCTGVDFEKQELNLENQSEGTYTRPFNRVIGTDGSASAVRSSIMEANGGTCSVAPLEHGYKELLLPSGYQGSFLIEKNALHIWPRGEFMLIALPNSDGSFTVTLFMLNKEDPSSFQTLENPLMVQAFFEEFFPDFVPDVPDLSEQFFSNPTGHLATVRCKGWQFQDKALILGDAAHAIVPFHGQGMNAAFESCRTFSQCLDRAENRWDHAFQEVERLRKPNTDAIADMALENYIEMRSSVRNPRYQLKKKIAFELERRFPDYFIPRYSMVMFHLLPYAEAKRRGVLQNELLEQIAENFTSIEQVDFEQVESKLKALGPITEN